jgi:putative acetyltransferase
VSGPARGLAVRPERTGDIDAIRSVELAAFETSIEADIVDALRGACDPFLSLVAEKDGSIVGHVLFTDMSVEPTRDGLALGLAPLAVAPEYQRRGIGSALVDAGLQACREAGAALVFVLGDPDFYGRFGFRPADEIGIACRWEVPPGAFAVVALDPRAVVGAPAVARYHHAFDDAV